jgi:hypothetical protein
MIQYAYQWLHTGIYVLPSGPDTMQTNASVRRYADWMYTGLTGRTPHSAHFDSLKTFIDSCWVADTSVNVATPFGTFRADRVIGREANLEGCADFGPDSVIVNYQPFDSTVVDWMNAQGWAVYVYDGTSAAQGADSLAAIIGCPCGATPVGTTPAVLPQNYTLSQNYPNPFNATTTIRYSVPKESRLSLVVFNTLGQKVLAFDLGHKSAGEYSFTFDFAPPLASGVYFYTLEIIDGKIVLQPRKMVFIK